MHVCKGGSFLAAAAAVVISFAAGTRISFAQQPRPQAQTDSRRVQASGYRLPVLFEPNVGQADPRVKYLSRTRDGILFIASDEAILAVSEPPAVPRRGERVARVGTPMQSGGLLTMRLIGANPHATVEGRGKASALINYFIGRDPSRWHSNIPTVNEVVAHEAWPGVDVSYDRDLSAGSEAFECTFSVRAGANISAVRVAFDAPGDVVLTPDGDIETAIGIRKITFTRPRVFEDGIDGRHEISAKFVTVPSLRHGGTHQLDVRFEVARHDPGSRLIIDPSLIYSTYLGGSGEAKANTIADGTGDRVNAMALDQDGNEYLTGATTSPDFPTTDEAFFSSCNNGGGPCDPAFITKIDGKTGAVIYSTLLGGGAGGNEGLGNGDEGLGIAVDQFGNAYVAGATFSTSFPTTPGALVPSCNFCQPVPFVTKLSADGSSLLYSTLLEKSNTQDYANAIAIDESGNAYVTGSINGDAFAIVLNPTGTAATYSVALASATGYAVALTKNHEIWIGGQTAGVGFPTTAKAFQRKCKKCSEDFAGFVSLLDPSKGSTKKSLVYSTYVGGSAAGDVIRAIAVDSKSRAWAVGSASPSSFKGKTSEVNCAKHMMCGNHALVAIFDGSKSGGSSLARSEYLGGGGSDAANAIFLAGSGVAYIGGQTTSSNFPVTSNAVQSTYTPCTGCEQYRGPAFVAVLNPFSKKSGLVYSTYLGGATVPSPISFPSNERLPNLVELDAVNGISLDSNGVIHAAGLTYASGFPTTSGAQQTVCQACLSLGSDGFVVRINPNASTSTQALEYSSYLGGGGPRFIGDSAAGVAMDGSGNIYVGGLTTSIDFPVTSGAFQQNCDGCVSYNFDGSVGLSYAAFVAKLNPTAAPGDQLVYATYLDGSSPNSQNIAETTGIAVDAEGEAYAVGLSDANFPTTSNAFSNTCSGSGSECLFFAKLDSTGSQLLYSSFVGTAVSASVAIDPNQNALIAGATFEGISVTPGAVQGTCNLCNLEFGITSGYFSKVNPNAMGAASLVYATYLSGSGGKFGATETGDALSAVTADANGNAVLTGTVSSPDFPTTPNAYQTQCQGICDSPAISVINPALSGQAALVYSTFVNGTGGDSNPIAFPYAVAVDSNGDIYIGGQISGYDFPVSPNAFIPQCPAIPCGAGSGFIAELNPNAAPANQLVYGTYLGGASTIGNEAVTGLGVDSNGRIYAAGHTLSANFPVTSDAAQPTCLACPGASQDSGNDGFLTVLNPAASGASQLVYSTFLGGNNYDAATGLAIGPMGLVALAGYSSSSDFPTTPNAFQLDCPACLNIGERGNQAIDGPLLLNSDAFVSVFQF
jgi:Beta-propeller repeat